MVSRKNDASQLEVDLFNFFYTRIYLRKLYRSKHTHNFIKGLNVSYLSSNSLLYPVLSSPTPLTLPVPLFPFPLLPSAFYPTSLKIQALQWPLISVLPSVGTPMDVIGVTKHFLTRFKVCATR